MPYNILGGGVKYPCSICFPLLADPQKLKYILFYFRIAHSSRYFNEVIAVVYYAVIEHNCLVSLTVFG